MGKPSEIDGFEETDEKGWLQEDSDLHFSSWRDDRCAHVHGRQLPATSFTRVHQQVHQCCPINPEAVCQCCPINPEAVCQCCLINLEASSKEASPAPFSTPQTSRMRRVEADCRLWKRRSRTTE